MIYLKKGILSFCLLAVMLSVCSCLKPIQLNERAIVQAIGIDYDDKAEAFNLTYQVFSPTTGGGGSIGASSDNAKIIESKGSTVSEAIQNATLVQGKQLFVGHNRIIIIGRKAAELDIRQALGYFMNNPDSKKNVNVVIADGDASEILKVKINQGMLPAETLQKIVENANENGIIENVKLFQFVQALDNSNESAVLPIMKANKKDEQGSGGNAEKPAGEESESEKKPDSDSITEVSTISMDGMAVIADKAFKTKLNKQESRGVLWIRDEVKNTLINAKTEKLDSAAIEVYSSKTRIEPIFLENDEKIRFIVKISCKASIGEVDVKEGKTVAPDDIKSVQRSGARIIEQECTDAFNTVFKEHKSDVFSLGKVVYHKNTALWKRIQNDWENMSDGIEIEVKASVDIDRVGLEFPTE